MKIRNGFVSNSSSTAFMFIMKEPDLDKLCEVVERQWANEFYLSGSDDYQEYPTYEQIDSKMVAESIRLSYDLINGQGMHSYGEKKKFIPIDEVIKDQSRFEEDLKSDWDSYFYKMGKEQQTRYRKLLQFKKQGFKWVLVIDFGNDGVVSNIIGQTIRGEGVDLPDTPSVKFIKEEWS